MTDLHQQRRSVAALDRPATTITRAVSAPVEARIAANARGSVTIAGIASRTGIEYEMFDAFGSYVEVVAAGAFTETLAANPTVLFTINHGGLALASTTAGDLTLDETDDGLTYEATLPLADPDVFALAAKVERGAVTESSMMFRITGAQWNDALDRRTITGIDLERGDVSAVLYGANPHTTITIGEERAAGAVDERRFERAYELAAREHNDRTTSDGDAVERAAEHDDDDTLGRRHRLLDAEIRLAGHAVS